MNTPSADYRRTHFRRPREMRRGLDSHAHRLAHAWHRRDAATLRAEARRILDLAMKWRETPANPLCDRLAEHRLLLRKSPEREDLHAALALIVESARREVGLFAHPEQVMGTLALARGFLAEMHTGEGKTLAIGLAAVLAAWTSPACHVLTANDYLAARDAAWLRPLYAACGLTVGCVTGEMPEAQRAENYACDITYTTAKEVTADFLRDQLRLGGALHHPARRLVQTLLHPDRDPTRQLVLRGLHSAIVDEADHALIDEAVTPLIISRPQENAPLTDASRAAHEWASQLVRGEDYEAHPRDQRIILRPAAVARLRSIPAVSHAAGRRVELLTQALAAREFFHRGKQYLIDDGKVVIIDEAIGRLMPQRTWRQGLHQAIEAKENLEITAPAETLARLSFQRFFRLYDRLAGITGTAREAAGECWRNYDLPFVAIATHRPCIRSHWPDRVFADDSAKWRAVVGEIERLHRLGRPVLVGTRSVAASQHLAGLLTPHGLDFTLLNAEREREEAATIARAGQPGQITIATNMAGRGTDIVLGPGVAAAGGLHVLATERHESARIDRQLFGRAGRQGDPGSAQAFVSLDDDLLKKFAPAWACARLANLLRLRAPAAEILAARLVRRAQSTAEHAAKRQRETIVQTDTWLDQALAFATGESAIAT